MIKIAVIGASGYSGAQLVNLLENDTNIKLQGLYVSEGSQDLGRSINELYPTFSQISTTLSPLSAEAIDSICKECDGVALATAHEVSLTLAQTFHEAGLAVFDLSGAYRMQDADIYPTFYGFEHNQPALLQQAVYGLAEWQGEHIARSKMIAVPGCYPTASLLALKPVANLLAADALPIINAVSGVSGAGRKASLTTSFNEVSLTPYGVFGHRHQPEISEHLGREVIFTPHLGNFKRGILATITVKLAPNVTPEQVAQAYDIYQDCPHVNVVKVHPKVDDVVGTPNCHISWQMNTKNNHLIIVSAIDNLLKGAASQAYQCIKLHFGEK